MGAHVKSSCLDTPPLNLWVVGLCVCVWFTSILREKEEEEVVVAD